MLKKMTNFLTVDIWRIRIRDITKSKAFFLKPLRILVLSFRGYTEDKCQFRASALTFYTLLSIVPVLAMMFGIAKGFGIEKMVEKELFEKVQGQDHLEKVVTQIIDFSKSMLEQTQGGLIAGIGIAILFVTVIRVLGNIESSFNYIWGVKRNRPLGRKITDYLSVMLICPILLVLSSSATVFVATQIKNITGQIEMYSALQKMILLCLRLLPYFSLWVVFSFIFIFMPNAKVKLKSGIIAGIIAGTIFQIVQILYIKFQVGVARYNGIYGSFAALPLFLAWLQLSWFVVLFGAEVSFAHQNVDTYELEPDCLNASLALKKKVLVFIAGVLAKNFCDKKTAMTASQISNEYDIPIRLTREVLDNLTEAGIASEVHIDDGRDFGYQPGRDIDSLTITEIIKCVENKGNTDIPMKNSAELESLTEKMDKIYQAATNCQSNVLVKDL